MKPDPDALPAPDAPPEPTPRRPSRTVLGVAMGSGLLLLVVLAAWLAGWLGGKGPGGNAAKVARQLPAADLKTDLASPTERAEPSLQDSLAAIAAGVDARAKLLDDDARFASKRGRWGDSREVGEKEATARNWEFHFPKGNTKDKYARQLDFFGIELAVVMPDNKLVYVSNFSKPKPETHSGPADQEKRCYLTWQKGDLSRADSELLERAGVSPGDRIVLKILPADLEAKLATLETEHAGDKEGTVVRTQFGIRAAGDGYEFYVAEQTRKERPKK